MPGRSIDPQSCLRALALAGVTVLGLATLLGSGGGLASLPSDCPPGLDCSGQPPPPSADVQPHYVTALVGTSATFTASIANAVGNATYQWSRSTDGGITHLDIPGATASTYTLPAVNLADDATTFVVTAHINGVLVSATGLLTVSATPGLVFEDGEFQDADWLATPFADVDGRVPVQADDREAGGGNPGAFRKMVVTLPAQSGSGKVLYTSLAVSYDPQAQGAVHVIDYAEDGIALQPGGTTSTGSALMLEQAGRRFAASSSAPTAPPIPTHWSGISNRASLRAQDFTQIDGPACGTGEACPDFSASGLPMRFGYWRVSFGNPGDVIAHGIDNWKVTVWRQ